VRACNFPLEKNKNSSKHETRFYIEYRSVINFSDSINCMNLRSPVTVFNIFTMSKVAWIFVTSQDVRANEACVTAISLCSLTGRGSTLWAPFTTDQSGRTLGDHL
jgi:hypothetical protein